MLTRLTVAALCNMYNYGIVMLHTETNIILFVNYISIQENERRAAEGSKGEQELSWGPWQGLWGSREISYSLSDGRAGFCFNPQFQLFDPLFVGASLWEATVEESL